VRVGQGDAFDLTKSQPASDGDRAATRNHSQSECQWLVGCSPVMNRHTTFKFCLDPNDGQQQVLARHAGASRLAFNQCLRMVKTALTQRETDPDTPVPWTGFDL